jgi:hypothetical protein
MSRIVIVILIYHHHKLIDRIHYNGQAHRLEYFQKVHLLGAWSVLGDRCKEGNIPAQLVLLERSLPPLHLIIKTDPI